MANVLSLAMKINADASGFKLDPVQRALVGLGEEADRVTKQFDKFASGSDAAASVQAKFAGELQALQNALRDGSIGATQFAVEFERLSAAANAEAKAFERAAQITEASLTPQQKYQRTVAELKAQLDAGRISQETYSAAMDKAKASLDKAGDSASKTDKSIKDLNSNVSLLTKIEVGRVLIDGLQAITSAFQSVTSQVTSLVSSVNSSVDQLNDFSARTGIGVEALQSYSLAAKLAGVDSEQFGLAVQRLAVTIGKATPGDQLDKSLRGIGLSVAELRALAPEQQFAAIGNAISQLPTAADRAAAAVEIFGKQGAALAPLFREGAASIEELRQRAENLGIIVSEDQVANVAAMNDAFDLVSATVQGIIGQVLGNLAPAVTAVTEEFLKFVEEWSGAEGSGGTGIANAITDVLLKGADVLAGVFDYAVEQFNGFAESLGSSSEAFAAVSSTLGVIGNAITSAVEGLRVVFNTFEIIGNGISLALGKVLEGIGSWVSSDMEAFGQELQRSAKTALEQNNKEIEAAATNAANAVANVFDGATENAAESGAGSARAFVKSLSDDIQNARLPEVKIESNADKLRERFDTLFNGLVDQSSKVTGLMQEFEQALAKAQEDGALTADEIAQIESLQRAVNDALDEEARKRQESADAARVQIEADQKRVEALLKPTGDTNKLEADIAAVYREQARAQEQLAAARAAGSQEEANQAAARLAQLDQTLAKLEEVQQANDQGFGDGYDKTFKATAASLDSIIEKAAKFGNEGAKAAQQLQDGIARAQEQVRRGILSKDAYEAEVAAQRKVYEQRLAQLDQIAKLEQQRRDAEFQAQVAANNRLDAYMQAQMTERQRAEVVAAEEAFKRRQQAAENLKAIEDRIALQRQSIEAAREANDLNSAKARQAELNALEKLQKFERKIAEGKSAANGQISRAADAAAQAQLEQQQVIANTAQRQIDATNAAASDAVGSVNNAFEQAAEKQRKLINDLNTLGSRTVQTADVRTQEGAAIILGLAANAQDPRLIEARTTNKFLRGIASSAAGTFTKLGLPATILG